MKEFKGLVANNQVEEKLLDVANLANTSETWCGV